MIALSVNGPVVKRPSVREYWGRHYREAAGEQVAKRGDAECLISGRVGPIARTHEKIKGLKKLGGQSAGVSLMSFDKDAFCSYGWEQNANSPVSPDRAMAYVLALNDLLRIDKGHRRDIAGVGFIFWTKERSDFDPMSNVDQPDPAQIDRLLRFDPTADPDPNMFYMAGVAGNGGRMLIRYWVAETLGTVKANLRDWFAGLRVADVYTGKPAEPPKLWQLLRAIDRKGEPPADRVIAVLRRALEGQAQPFGYRMLSAALTRLRAETHRRLDPVRLGLIRLCLNDLISPKGESLMSESLDSGQRHPAYLSGRLLAVYESLQYAVNRGVNQTVTDRYYSLASTNPALAFPKLEDLGQKHLRKLRRENPGARVRIEQEIGKLHVEIEQACGFRFPALLDLEAQGRFALGYHHQRAHQMTQAQKAKANQLEAGQKEENQ
ncbi:MAG: type I-C CRISPR-associated protein Cas8c/Csd1 [Acidobacteriaceae bacterium]|nr:type I-C CRISPR-associated protein Cas8c/Csd1 [Acidobacteriaceae bacterium]